MFWLLKWAIRVAAIVGLLWVGLNLLSGSDHAADAKQLVCSQLGVDPDSRECDARYAAAERLCPLIGADADSDVTVRGQLADLVDPEVDSAPFDVIADTLKQRVCANGSDGPPSP